MSKGPKKIFDSLHILSNISTSMKTLRPSHCALLLASIAVSGLHAQTTATTDPVGFVSYTVNANSDQKVGVPMTQASVFSGAATSVSGTSVTTSGVPALSGKNLLLVTSGSSAGSWEEIASSTGTTVTLLAPISGFANSDSFVIRPFWTLGSLFHNGGAVPISPDPENPRGLVLLNDLTAVGINPASGASYLYHDGSILPAGWYENGTFADANDTIVSPESFITVRNLTSSPVSLVFVGSVPVESSAIDVVRRPGGQQDNLVLNQFPSAVTLANSGLNTSGAVTASPDPENPVDTLLVYSLSNTGLNPASSSSYLYHDGSILPAGWYENGSFADANDISIPAGGAIVIRKGAGSDQVTKFAPSLPYSLQ
jgi:uncharacterized protein (TIGR02597 family)